MTNFLEERVFNPVLAADPEGYSRDDRDKLQDVQDATRSEIERFRNYESAEEILVNFRRDLHSKPAEKIHRESHALKLPTLNDVRDEFEEMARSMGLHT